MAEACLVSKVAEVRGVVANIDIDQYVLQIININLPTTAQTGHLYILPPLIISWQQSLYLS